MKGILFAAVLVLCLSAGASEPKGEIFKKYERVEGASTMSISSALMCIASTDDGASDMLNLSGIANRVSRLRAVSSELSDVIASINADAQSYIEKCGAEQLTTINQSGAYMQLYTLNGEGESIQEFIILNDDSDGVLSFMIIEGEFTREDISTLFSD